MPTDSYAHELRRKTPTSSKHDVKKNRSDSGYSTSSSTSAGSNSGSKAAAHKSHSHSHHPTHGPSSSSSSGSKRGRARFSVPEDAQGMSKFASLTGFLRKQADNEEGAWNRYYFALRPATYLYYYNTPSDDRPRGIIDLEFLQDIQYNVDCLQRSVGGSEYCFRMTGQIPKGTLKDVVDTDKLKLRPVFLDPESSDESRQWMEALKKHRFNIDHAEGFIKMGLRVKETEYTLKQLGEEAQRVTSTAESIRWKGRALLNKLRGIDCESVPMNADPESRGSFDVDNNQDDIFSTLQKLESLVEDFSAEAEQQARVIETLREREVQQAKVIEMLREKETQQEKKIRELIKNGPPAAALSSSNGPDSRSYSVISEEELSRMDRMGAAKGRSTSNVQELFKKTTSFLSSKKTADGANAPASSPMVLEACIEVPEEESDAPAVATKKTGGFVDAIKKRVAKNTTITITQASTPTSRESDDTVSITTDDRGSVEIATSNDDKLPPGWTKRESRNHSGEYYYAHTSGFTCWDLPNDFLLTKECDELLEEGGDGGNEREDEPEQQSVVSDADLEKSEFYGKQPLGSLAAVAQAVMEAAANEPAATDKEEDDKPMKKSKGWAFLKKLKKGSAAAPAQSPKQEPSPVIAVEHEDGRHEF